MVVVFTEMESFRDRRGKMRGPSNKDESRNLASAFFNQDNCLSVFVAISTKFPYTFSQSNENYRSLFVSYLLHFSIILTMLPKGIKLIQRVDSGKFFEHIRSVSVLSLLTSTGSTLTVTGPLE